MRKTTDTEGQVWIIDLDKEHRRRTIKRRGLPKLPMPQDIEDLETTAAVSMIRDQFLKSTKIRRVIERNYIDTSQLATVIRYFKYEEEKWQILAKYRREKIKRGKDLLDKIGKRHPNLSRSPEWTYPDGRPLSAIAKKLIFKSRIKHRPLPAIVDRIKTILLKSSINTKRYKILKSIMAARLHNILVKDDPLLYNNLSNTKQHPYIRRYVLLLRDILMPTGDPFLFMAILLGMFKLMPGGTCDKCELRDKCTPESISRQCQKKLSYKKSLQAIAKSASRL